MPVIADGGDFLALSLLLMFGLVMAGAGAYAITDWLIRKMREDEDR
jgi:hypothetical protein